MNSQVKEFLLHKERRACANQGYKVDDKYLGGGATGRVFLARPTKKKIRSSEKLMMVKKENKQLKVAIKICYADVGADYISALWTCLPAEIANCNKCFGLPNIVNLLDVFVASKRIFLVMEYAAKGDLRQVFKEHICRNPQGKRHLEEGLAAHYFSEIAKGVKQMHTKNIAHRDLKLDNVLVMGDGQVKICDLGFSVAASKQLEIPQELLAISNCGTRGYVAPEVSKRHETPYNPFKADVWSLGIILFLLTNGYLPFDGKTSEDIYQKISDSEGQPLPFRKGLSLGCKELLSRLLKRSPKDRPTVNEIVQDQWLAQHTLLNKSPLDTKNMTWVSGNSVYKFQPTYVSHYLWQRMMLLEERRSFLLNAGNSPEDLRDAGIIIALPKQDTGGVRVTEVWRLEENELRKTDVIPNPYKRKHDRKRKVLEDPWTWSPDVEEPTLGIRCVERVVTNSPLLGEWREFLEKGKSPEMYFEYCMINRNTVELAEKSWRPIERVTRPCPKRDKAYQWKAKFANVRQNMLGFCLYEMLTSNGEDVSSKDGSGEESLKKSAISCNVSSAKSRAKEAVKITNDQKKSTNLEEQRHKCNQKETRNIHICQVDKKQYSPTAGVGKSQSEANSEKSDVPSPTSDESKNKIIPPNGEKIDEKPILGNTKASETPAKVQNDRNAKDKQDFRSKRKGDKNRRSKKSKRANKVAEYTKAGKQSRVDVHVEAIPKVSENPLCKFSKQKVREQPIMKPVDPFIYRAVLELLSISDSDVSNETKCNLHLSRSHLRRNVTAATNESRKNLKRADSKKIKNVAQTHITSNVVRRADFSKPSQADDKLKEDVLKSRRRSLTSVDPTIGDPRAAYASLKKQPMRSNKHIIENNAAQPTTVVKSKTSRSSNQAMVGAILDEVNLVPNSRAFPSNFNNSIMVGDSSHKAQDSTKLLVERSKQNIKPHLKGDKPSEFPEHSPMCPSPPKFDRKSTRPYPSVMRRSFVASKSKSGKKVEHKGPAGLVEEGRDLTLPRAPKPPNHAQKSLSVCKGRMLNNCQSPQNQKLGKEEAITNNVYSRTGTSTEFYAPRPPKQDKNTSAQIQRRSTMRQSVDICEKEDNSRTTLTQSGKLSDSNAVEGSSIQDNPYSNDKSQGDQPRTNGVSMPSNHVNVKARSTKPKAEEIQIKRELPQAGNYSEVKKAFKVVSRRFGRILRLRSPNEGEPRDVGRADLKPERPRETKLDKIRKTRFVESSETKGPERQESNARVEVVTGKPLADPKHSRSAILQRRYKFLNK